MSRDLSRTQRRALQLLGASPAGCTEALMLAHGFTPALVRDGLATLDGRVLTDSAEHVPLAPDLSARMRIDGAPLDPLAPLTLILHKPLAVVCSHKEAGRSVYELLPSRWRRRDPPLGSNRQPEETR